MKLTRTMMIAMTAFAVAAFAEEISPKAQSEAFAKEASEAFKEKRFDDAFAAYEKAWNVEGLSPAMVDKFQGEAQWNFTMKSGSPDAGHKMCDAIIASPKAAPGRMAGAMGWKSKKAREGKKFAEAREWQAKIREVKGRKPEEIAGSFAFDAETFVEEGEIDIDGNGEQDTGIEVNKYRISITA